MAAASTALSMLARDLSILPTARVSSDIADLRGSACNIVHIRRSPHAALATSSSSSSTTSNPLLLSRTGVHAAVVPVADPEAAVAYLAGAVQHPPLQQQLAADIQLALQQLGQVLSQDHLHVKLQLVTRQSCPRWHADTVRLRLLATYDGPGTWFVPNRHVRRRLDPWTGDISVSEVDEAHAQQAGVGNLLFLKGNAFPGLRGAGAVHKSPEVQDGEARLLLTVDDACCSGSS